MTTGRGGAQTLAVLLTLVCLCGSPLSLGGQDAGPLALAPSGEWGPAADSADRVIRALKRRAGVPGISVAVGVNGEQAWAEGFGFADVEHRVPVWPETRFRVASISKALTAAAVARLHEEERLDLDAPVQRYVPSFPQKDRGTVTTRLLGGHLAGIRHYRGAEFLSRTRYEDVVDALEIFAEDSLEHPPGSEYRYSTYGWNLVSAVVQGAAGEPFLHYMRRAVFDPLGMRETVAEHPDSIIHRRASPYMRADDGRLLNAPWVDNSNKWAGGGYLSTAPDLVRYGQAWLGGEFLEPGTVELFHTRQTTTGGDTAPYGIGWRILHDGDRKLVYHTGGAVGGSTVLLLDPERRVVVAILTNLQGLGDLRLETAREVLEIFAEQMTMTEAAR